MPAEVSERIRIEIAFDGGQVVNGLVAAADADELERALADEGRTTIGFEAEDGHYTLALRRVLYVKRFAREARVGFGA